jgi:hypothetical protein
MLSKLLSENIKRKAPSILQGEVAKHKPLFFEDAIKSTGLKCKVARSTPTSILCNTGKQYPIQKSYMRKFLA